MAHIVERSLIHFVSSAFLVLAAFYLYSYWARRNKKVLDWIPEGRPRLVISALSVFAISTLREPIDMALGQSVTKAIFDFISWLLGTGVSSWGLYRFKLKISGRS